MYYLDANIVYPMFAITKKRLDLFYNTGSSGNTLLDYCIDLLRKADKRSELLILSDLSVLETLGVASRDIGPEKAKMILQAIHKQIFLEVIQTSQSAWLIAKAMSVKTSIEARDSLHLAIALLTDVVTSLITCDKDFTARAQIFLTIDYEKFSIAKELQTWYRFSDMEILTLERKIVTRATSLNMELISLTE